MKEIDEIEKEIERLKDEKRIIENNTTVEISVAMVIATIKALESHSQSGFLRFTPSDVIRYLEEKLEELD